MKPWAAKKIRSGQAVRADESPDTAAAATFIERTLACGKSRKTVFGKADITKWKAYSAFAMRGEAKRPGLSSGEPETYFRLATPSRKEDR